MRSSRYLYAVDPGIRGCGVALFNWSRLVAVGYIKNPARTGNRASEAAKMARAAYEWLLDFDHNLAEGYGAELAVEWMRVYASRIQAGDADAVSKDPNDLLPLTGIDAALAALMPESPCASYVAAEWKGQVKKPACHRRAYEERLEPAERQVWDAAAETHGSLAHNAHDAVCIGLHHLGRGFLDEARRRVFPGVRD